MFAAKKNGPVEKRIKLVDRLTFGEIKGNGETDW
jgi:hypothetical protein